MVPRDLTNVTGGKVILENYVQVGANTVIMPNVILSEGSCIGAMSFVKKNTENWKIYAGIPCKEVKKRKKEVINLSKKI